MKIGFGRKVLQVIEEAGLSYEHTPSGIDTMNVIVELNSFIEHEQEILANLHRAVEPDSIELESDLAFNCYRWSWYERWSWSCSKSFYSFS